MATLGSSHGVDGGVMLKRRRFEYLNSRLGASNEPGSKDGDLLNWLRQVAWEGYLGDLSTSLKDP